jgi:hypothetical protein
MAPQKRPDRKPTRASRRRKPTGDNPHPRRVSPSFDARGRVKIHTSKSGAEGAFVYVAQSAKGVIKVGYTVNLKSRIFGLHNIVGWRHRPIVLVCAVRLDRALAFKVERFTQYLLDGQRGRMIYPGLGPSKEWYRCSVKIAQAALGTATDYILAAKASFGHDDFYWRKAIPQ